MQMTRPAFSIVHPSARPDEFCKTRDLWIETASRIADFEYVAAFDLGADMTPERAAPARLVWSLWGKCSNDATNVAALAAVGQVLVVISDDVYPCQDWDLHLRNVPQLWSDKPCVLRVSTGGNADTMGLYTVQILNRARYEQLGYLFHPSYVSMYGDEEFSEHARRDGVVVDARHITFRHDHWSNPGGPGEPTDEVYRKQNDPKRYEYGRRLYAYREARGFPRLMPDELMKAKLQAV